MRCRFGPKIVAATDRRVRELVAARRQLRAAAPVTAELYPVYTIQPVVKPVVQPV